MTATTGHSASASTAPANTAPPTLEGVVTARAFVQGGLLRSVEAVRSVLGALRAAGATEDVLGFAIPLVGDPSEPRSRAPLQEEKRRRFDLKEFLLLALDPHQPLPGPDEYARTSAGVLTKALLGDLVKWIVGVHTFRVPLPDGAGELWVLGRPNHASAMQRFRGDATAGPAGTLASFAVPAMQADRYARALAEGRCIVTTCETDEGRMRRDRKLLVKHGASDFFETPLTVVYGERPA